MGNCIQRSSSISSSSKVLNNNTVTVRNDADDNNIRDTDTIEVDERKKKKQQIEPSPAVTPSSTSSLSPSPSPSNDKKENSTTPNNNNNNNIEITERTIPSSIENDDYQIPIKIFQPTTKPRATVFFIHGGMFVQGDRDSHSTISKALASQLNLIVVTATFRNGKDAPHGSNITMRDLHDVVDFVQKKGGWSDLPFGLVGSSSGGYFALQLSNTLGPLGGVKFCIPICPVADPFKRASYLRSSMRGSARSDGYNSFHDPDESKFILEKQLSYWGSDSSMKEAGRSISKRNLFDSSSNDKKEKDTESNSDHNHIPTLLIIGSADKNVPFDVTADVQSWATRTIVVGGRGHELCDKIIEGGGYHCYLSDIDRFIEYCLSLE